MMRLDRIASSSALVAAAFLWLVSSESFDYGTPAGDPITRFLRPAIIGGDARRLLLPSQTHTVRQVRFTKEGASERDEVGVARVEYFLHHRSGAETSDQKDGEPGH